MSTGLFPSRDDRRGGPRKGYMPKNRRAAIASGKVKLDAFAEALSQHGDVKRAAAAVGTSYQYGRQLLKKLRAELGWQAC